MNTEKRVVSRHEFGMTAKAIEQARDYAKRYGLQYKDVLDRVVINVLPLSRPPGRCNFCDGKHATKRCPNQLPLFPRAGA